MLQGWRSNDAVTAMVSFTSGDIWNPWTAPIMNPWSRTSLKGIDRMSMLTVSWGMPSGMVIVALSGRPAMRTRPPEPSMANRTASTNAPSHPPNWKTAVDEAAELRPDLFGRRIQPQKKWNPEEWKDPNWKDPDIVLPNFPPEDIPALPLSEIVVILKREFKDYFDVLLPLEHEYPIEYDLDETAISLHLKNVRASEFFNAMNLLFETENRPFRWQLLMNGNRPTAVLRVLPEKGSVVVEGVNLVYRHVRRSQKHPQGGRVRRESPVDLSNVGVPNPML